MTRLLATSAIALVALSGAASAQSVLERVLGQIDNATNLASVNGTFANIAENIGGVTEVNTYAATGAVATTSGSATTAVGLTGTTQEAYDAFVARNTVSAVFDSAGTDLVYYDVFTGNVIRAAQWDQLSTAEKAAYTQVTAGNTLLQNADGTFNVIPTTDKATQLASRAATIAAVPAPTVAYTGALDGINGSINNTIDGITDVTQQAIASSSVSAIEYNMPTFDFGDMATTALGAVNTGDITLGVNSAVDEASTSTTNAISAVIDQIGGSADTGAIILNVASNMTGVNGSINNTMQEINGSLGNLSTTALGAVNTGTIVSGVDAAVAGIVGSTSGGSNGL